MQHVIFFNFQDSIFEEPFTLKLIRGLFTTSFYKSCRVFRPPAVIYVFQKSMVHFSCQFQEVLRKWSFLKSTTTNMVSISYKSLQTWPSFTILSINIYILLMNLFAQKTFCLLLVFLVNRIWVLATNQPDLLGGFGRCLGDFTRGHAKLDLVLAYFINLQLSGLNIQFFKYFY